MNTKGELEIKTFRLTDGKRKAPAFDSVSISPIIVSPSSPSTAYWLLKMQVLPSLSTSSHSLWLNCSLSDFHFHSCLTSALATTSLRLEPCITYSLTRCPRLSFSSATLPNLLGLRDQKLAQTRSFYIQALAMIPLTAGLRRVTTYFDPLPNNTTKPREECRLILPFNPAAKVALQTN